MIGRTSVRISCSRSVFTVSQCGKHVTYNEIQGLLSATRKMSRQNKKDVFYANGVDFDNVEKYYEYMQKLEITYSGLRYNASVVDKNRQLNQPWYFWRLAIMYLLMLFGP